jgi:hypothetical protein
MSPNRRSPAEPIPYEEVNHPDFAQHATQTFTIETVSPGIVLLHGTCPRCHARIQVPFVDKVFRTWSKGRPDGRGSGESALSGRQETIICTCEEQHPNRPDDHVGCGAYWILRFEQVIQ